MLRWLGRLLLVGLILAAIGFVVSRLLGRDEDFDEFDDIDEGFDFQETPVEIDVPAEDNFQSTGNLTIAFSSEDVEQDQGGQGGNVESATEMPTTVGSSNGAEAPTAEGGEASGAKLSDIKGIGPAYEAGLHAMGIEHFNDLINSDPASLSEQLGVIGGQSAVEDWITQARDLAAGGPQNNGNNA